MDFLRFCCQDLGAVPPNYLKFSILVIMVLYKGHLISKANFEVSFEPKNERIYFCISVLASKMGLIIKIMAYYHAY